MSSLPELTAELAEHRWAGALLSAVFLVVMFEQGKHRRRRRSKRRSRTGSLAALWRRFRRRRRPVTADQGPRNFTGKQSAEVYDRDYGMCKYCLLEGAVTFVHPKRECDQEDGCDHCGEIDHVISYDDGGPTELWNALLSCREHNRAKGARTGAEFLASTGVRW